MVVPGHKEPLLDGGDLDHEPPFKRRRAESPEPSPSKPSTRQTYRVRCIPASYSLNTTRQLLKRSLRLGEDCADDYGLRVRSLALDATDETTKVATVDFEREPRSLKLPKGSRLGRWEFTLDDGEGKGYLLVDTDFLGLTTLAHPEESHEVDIVAVTGLAGHAFHSFRAKDGDHMWLRDALPSDIPTARILIYGYDTRLLNTESFQDLEALGRALCGHLQTIESPNPSPKPKIFIGHSLGGLVIKQALILLRKWNDSRTTVLHQTSGVMFFGVPNQGMRIEHLLPIVKGGPGESLIHALGTESQLLRELSEQFADLTEEKQTMDIVCFYETVKSPTTVKVNGNWQRNGPSEILVGSASARHGRACETGSNVLPINKNHSEMAKFWRADADYLQVKSTLQQMVKNASELKITKATPDDTALLKKLQEHLNPPDPQPNHERSRKLRIPKTGNWFLTSSDFTDWRMNAKFLWLYGIPGCGKTILSSIIIDELSKQAAPVVCFYFDVNDKQKETFQGLLRSLLVQILALYPDLASYSKGVVDSTHPVPVGMLEDAIDAVLSNLSKDIYLIIDALDECIDQRGLLTWLRKMYQKHGPRIHLLVTSRQEETIARYLRSRCLEIPIQRHLVDNDIKIYVEDQLEQLPELTSLSIPAKVKISEELLQKANGMFRWAYCQVETLRECMDQADLEDALSSLPTDLNETYVRSLQKIPSKLLADSCKVLLWLVYAARPPRLEELAEVLTTSLDSTPTELSLQEAGVTKTIVKIEHPVTSGVSVDERKRLLRLDDILRYCGTLATTRQSDADGPRILILAHASVREFLERIMDGWDFWLTPPKSHRSISKMCLNYLVHVCGQSTITDGMPLDVVAKNYPLIEYTATFFQHHLKLAGHDSAAIPGGETAKILETRRLLSICKSYWDYYFRRMSNPFKLIVNDTSQPFHKACFFGLTSTVEVLIKQGIDINATTAEMSYLTGLDIACYNEDESTVRALLKAGARPTQAGGQHGDALQIVTWRQNLSIVSLLLQHGADANAPGGKHGMALQCACYNSNEAIVRLLIEAGADLNSIDEEYGTPLQAAVAARTPGNEKIVELLIQKGADIKQESSKHGDSLYTAVLNGREDLARILLNAGYKISKDCGQFGNIVQTAIHVEHEGLVRFLINSGVSVRRYCKKHGNVFTTAVKTGNISMVELVLELLGPAIVEKTKPQVLLDAVRRDGLHELRLFLAYGIKIPEVIYDLNENPLTVAIARGNLEIVETLLKYGANCNVQMRHDSGKKIQPCLQIAVTCGDAKMVRLLLDSNCSIDQEPHPVYGGIIQIAVRAVETQNDEIAKSKLQSQAIEERIEGIINLLLEGGADINQMGGGFGTALQAAVWLGQTSVVKFLLSRGANPNLGAKNQPAYYVGPSGKEEDLAFFDGNSDMTEVKWSPAGAAVSRGYQDILTMLVDHGAELDENILAIAAGTGYLDIVRYVLAQLKEVVHQEHILQIAAKRGRIQVVKELLDHGYPPTAVEAAAAANVNSEAVLSLLFERGAQLEPDILTTAATADNVGSVKLLLKYGAEVGDVDLLKLIRYRRQKSALFFLEQGCCPQNYMEAIEEATSAGMKDVLEILLSQSKDFGQAFRIALTRNDPAIIDLLLESGCDPNQKDIVIDAISYWTDARVKLLLHYNIELPENAIEIAINAGSDPVLRVLMAHGVLVTAKDLQAAITSDFSHCFAVLIEKGIDVNIRGGPYFTALHAAVAAHDMEKATTLLDHGADLEAFNPPGGTPLLLAIQKGYGDMVDLLLKRGASINATSESYGTVLHTAAYFERYRLIMSQTLLDKGADVNAVAGPFGTVLQAAAASWKQFYGSHFFQDADKDEGITECPLPIPTELSRLDPLRDHIKFWLEAGARLNIPGGYYGTALQAATAHPLPSAAKNAVELLLDAGADVNEQGGHFGNALNAAVAAIVSRNQRDGCIVRLLIARGASFGNVLEFVASFEGPSHRLIFLINLLVELGIDLKAAGSNALEAAKRAGNEEVVSFLISKGI